MAQKTMYPAINNSPVSKLVQNISANEDTIEIVDTSVLPAAPNIVTIGTDESAELILYEQIDGSSITGCTRGFNGTTARAWASGTKVYRGFTAYDHDAFVHNIKDLDETKAKKASDHTTGNLAALDTNGNPIDSGKKAGDFATSKQGSKAETAIQSVKTGGTELSPDDEKAVNIPVNEAYGMLQLDGNGKASVDQLPNYITGAPNFTYDGVNLKTIFANATQLHNAVQWGDFSRIRVGDYWPVRLNGSFYDYSSYTAPSGTNYYSNTALTTSAGTLSAPTEVTYFNETYCAFTKSGATYYVDTGECLPYFERTFTNVDVKFEVCPQVYLHYGDSESVPNHLLMVPRDCLPQYLKMRKTNSDWTNADETNPWLGSALYKTLNDPDHGIITLLAATDIGAYIYNGPNGNGMRFLCETKAAGQTNATAWSWKDRGKLFLPLECEVWGMCIWQDRTYGVGSCVQWPIFIGSLKHIKKAKGEGGAQVGWWCASTLAGSAEKFTFVSFAGTAGSGSNAKDPFSVAPCFLFT